MDGIISWWEYVSSRWDIVLATLTETLTYVIAVTVSAGFVAIVVGVATRNHPFAKELSLAIASVFLTIPSLALFTIFIPVVGLGFAPSFIALFLYALLPILRNTASGLDSVDPSVLESARGSASPGTTAACMADHVGRYPRISAAYRGHFSYCHPGGRWRTGRFHQKWTRSTAPAQFPRSHLDRGDLVAGAGIHH